MFHSCANKGTDDENRKGGSFHVKSVCDKRILHNITLQKKYQTNSFDIWQGENIW